MTWPSRRKARRCSTHAAADLVDSGPHIATSEFADEHLVSGFAALLNQIRVDIAFIRSPFLTAKREELRAESEDTVRVWLADAVKTDRAFVGWENLHDEYKSWVQNHCHARPENLKALKRKIVKAGFAYDEPRTINGKSQRAAVFVEKPAHLSVVSSTEPKTALWR